MSSLSLDASGSRGVSLTLNDPARTAVSIPSTKGDSATVQLGSFQEVSAYVPATARLELVRIPRQDGDGYDEMIRLVIPNGSLQLRCEGGETAWPHVGVSARKELAPDFYLGKDGAEIANSVPLAAAVLVEVEPAA